MPRYVYQCADCDEQFCVQHMSDESATECAQCKSVHIKKVLTSFSTSAAPARKFRVGQRTEEFIEESRNDLKQQKDDLDNKR